MKCPRCHSDNPETSRFCGNCAALLNPKQLDSSAKTISILAQTLSEGTLFANKYRVIDEIGQGGIGVVFKAEDTKLKRLVALKFLQPERTHSPESRERLIREAQAAAALDHPNICTVYEVEEQEGQVYIAMSYIDGKSLKERIVQEPLAIDEALDVTIQVAGGLEEAHRKGIIHRDIKPANIMLTDKGQPKITDFGLAKLESAADLTKTSTVMGTVAYMSPEQAVFQAIVNGDPQPIEALRHDIPVKLERIVMKCLQKDPRSRYPDAASLIEDLRAVDLQTSVSSPSLPPHEHAPSIAVLPFADMSPERDQDYFGEGIAEELIHALTRIHGLHVVSRTSAFAFKGKDLDVREIGQTLNVKTILEGSVRKAGNRLRVTAQLINVEDGFHVWSERFDRDAVDVFAIQDEIATALGENLRVTLPVEERKALRKRPTDDPEAYNLYLKGLYFAARPTAEACGKALGFFREALDRDPNFALAYTGMAKAFAGLGIMNFASPAEMWPKAKAALLKALDLDEDLPQAHAEMAAMALWYDWDWRAAEKSFERVLALNPGDAYSRGTYGWFMLSRRRFEEAVREVKKAVALDPLMPLYYAWSVGLHAATGRYDEAIQEFTKAMEIDPKLGLAYFHAGCAYFWKGEFDRAIEALKKSRQFGVYKGWAEAVMTLVYLKRGEKEKAARAFQEQLAETEKTARSPAILAWQAAALGDFDQAFRLFDKAYETRDLLMPFVHIYTDLFAPGLQRDPRFNDLVARMKLV